MMIRNAFFLAGCAATWAFVLPLLALAGFIALVGYAVLSGLGDWLFSSGRKELDPSKAREIASRLCVGH
jgi:hypothetical protein